MHAESICDTNTNMDRSIKLWDANTGSMLKSVNTGSQVCSPVWSGNEWEILSSHGFEKNELLLWKYPWWTRWQNWRVTLRGSSTWLRAPTGARWRLQGMRHWGSGTCSGARKRWVGHRKRIRSCHSQGYPISIRWEIFDGLRTRLWFSVSAFTTVLYSAYLGPIFVCCCR